METAFNIFYGLFKLFFYVIGPILAVLHIFIILTLIVDDKGRAKYNECRNAPAEWRITNSPLACSIWGDPLR